MVGFKSHCFTNCNTPFYFPWRMGRSLSQKVISTAMNDYEFVFHHPSDTCRPVNLPTIKACINRNPSQVTASISICKLEEDDLTTSVKKCKTSQPATIPTDTVPDNQSPPFLLWLNSS